MVLNFSSKNFYKPLLLDRQNLVLHSYIYVMVQIRRNHSWLYLHNKPQTRVTFMMGFISFQQIVGYPSTQVLTSEEKDLVWQFRFYLTNQKKVLFCYTTCRAASINKTIELILAGINMFWAQLRLKPKPLDKG